MTDAAVYVRISSDPTGQALGVAQQEKLCRELAEQLGWTVAEVFRDNNRSASSGRRRPEYERMLAAVEAGQVDAILAYAPDRLYRKLSDLARFIEVVKAAGAAVRTVAQSGEMDLSTAAGRTTAGILGVVAAGEVERLKERVVDKMKANAEAGKPHGGPRPYGWTKDQMTPVPAEAAVIEEAHRRVLAGESLRGIYRDFNARGVYTSTGKPWTHQTFRGVLMLPRHAGLRAHNKVVVGRAVWPPLICGGDREAAEAQHRAVVRVLSDPSRVTTPGRGGKLHLLSTLAVCGNGHPVYVGQSRGRVRVYRCKSWCVARHQAHVDEFVQAVIVERFKLLTDRERAALRSGPDAGAPEREAAEEKVRMIRQQLQEVAEDRAARVITREQMTTMTKRLTAQLEEAERAATPPADPGPELGGLIVPGREAETWEALSVERKRMIIGGLFTVTLRPGVRGHGWNPAGIEIESR